MTRYTTACGCTQEAVMGRKRPKVCGHGRLFEKVRPAGTVAKRPNPKQSKQPVRDWTDALAKVELEACCRICKRTDRKLDAAHVLGREHDEPKVSKSTGEILKELYVHPDRIFPACGPYPLHCHGDVDHNRINYLQYLTLEEQVKAVEDAGGIDAARHRLEPVEYREEVEATAVAPADLDPSPTTKEPVAAPEKSNA